jgi:hypothetical protein
VWKSTPVTRGRRNTRELAATKTLLSNVHERSRGRIR